MLSRDFGESGTALWSRGSGDRGVRSVLFISGVSTMWWVQLLVRRMASDEGLTGTLLLVLGASSFLVACPVLILRWERLRRQLVDSLGDLQLGHLVTSSFCVRMIAAGTPLLLIPGAFLYSEAFANTVLGAEIWSFTWFLSFATVVLGSCLAGQGIWAAWHSLEVSMRIAAGPTEGLMLVPREDLKNTNVIRFAVASAMLFGLATAVILPAMVKVAYDFPGVPRAVLSVMIVLILLTQIALIVGPATRLSQAEAVIRFEHLERLGRAVSADIERLIERETQDDASAERLSAILEIREHLVAFPNQDPTVLMVSRSLFVIAVPVTTALGTWVSIVS